MGDVVAVVLAVGFVVAFVVWFRRGLKRGDEKQKRWYDERMAQITAERERKDYSAELANPDWQEFATAENGVTLETFSVEGRDSTYVFLLPVQRWRLLHDGAMIAEGDGSPTETIPTSLFIERAGIDRLTEGL